VVNVPFVVIIVANAHVVCPKEFKLEINKKVVVVCSCEYF